MLVIKGIPSLKKKFNRYKIIKSENSLTMLLQREAPNVVTDGSAFGEFLKT